MKLLSLYLSNVRRFTGKRASITGIGDGISVVSQANEFGKSTFFDAVHALFFEKYSSSAKPVKSLRPYAGGAVEVAAEVQSGEDVFRVEKRFLSKPTARVSRVSQSGNATIAQDDEAERWIVDLLGSAQEGPAGILWVRQGLVGLEPDSSKEKSQQVETRRDLLSSVAGEIDTMTGGRRMDRVMARVSENLGAITTKTGKERGLWKAAVDEASVLQEQLDRVEEQVRTLGSSIAARQEAEAEFKRLDDPAANARRKTASARAQKAFDEAKAHDGKVAAARQNRDLAAVRAETAKGELGRFLTSLEGVEAAQKYAQTCAAAASSSKGDAERLKQTRDTAERAFRAADDAQKTARKSIDQARRQAGAKQAQETLKKLTTQIKNASQAKQNLEAAKAKVAASKATADWLLRVEDAFDAVSQARAAMAAQLTTMHVAYDGTTRIRVNGADLADDTSVAVEGRTELNLPGIGLLTLEAQHGNDQTKRTLAALETELDRLLADGEAQSIQEARELVEATRQAIADADLAAGMLKTLAPDGVDPLLSALAEADLAASGADDAPSLAIDQLEANLNQAETQATLLSQELGMLQADYAGAQEKAVKAAALNDGAQIALERAQTACGPEQGRDEARAKLLRADAQNENTLKEADAALRDLEVAAPDLLTAQAELTRANDAEASAVTQRAQLSEKLAALSSEIRTLAGNGIEEKRDELAGELETARKAVARFKHQSAALARLQSALNEERKAARDTYFGPVQEELKPLLSILQSDAALSFDGDSLLPSGLKRDQTEETLDSLSGGTKEQIAILTRLAFARLFARQGREMPIILDDALVYSDDDRIIKMFTALTRVAQDQQIIVFSCRQLAFQDLGGARPSIEIGAI